MPTTHYILFDFENLQPPQLHLLANHPNAAAFRLLVFVGAKQARVPFAFAATLQTFGCRAQYIKAHATGSNALDFYITFYLGQLVSFDPHACFYIISKDKGFNPLIQHLKQQGIRIQRTADLNNISRAKGV